MKNGVKYNWTRRNFVKTMALAVLTSPFITSCQKKWERFIFKITGTNHILGHRLRTKDFPKPTSTIKENIVIVGSGISALSAARWLTKMGTTDFKVIELEKNYGGNSSYGENDQSKYPYAAHYLPLPNEDNKELIDFLFEENIISHFENNQPIYAEQHLCYDPHERLFIHNFWQEGLIPQYGLTGNDIKVFQKFDQLISELKYKKGSDQKYAFDIPLRKSSSDEEFLALDRISFKEWLNLNELENEYLETYLNYCSKDDYGIGIDKVSAWAGLHYFCSRKNTKSDVLTWPEGNGYLSELLSKYTKNRLLTQHLVYEVIIENNQVLLYVYDEISKQSKIIEANQVIMATPQYVNQYVLKDRKAFTKKFQYAPWITATISINKFPIGEGAPLSWDNVIYNGFGLGYIYNQHQSLHSQHRSPFSITYYAALCEKDLGTERKLLFSNKDEYWKDIIINDLEKAHYQLSEQINTIELHKKGHGMISPFPNFLFSDEINQARKPIQNKIYFAHSDLSGISIFEEAFDQGIQAATQLLNESTLDT